jgi:beta-glucosidase
MKKLLFTTIICVGLANASFAQLPIYLDDNQPVEKRIDDALKRMTLDEKIAVIHAQSKFSSPGIKRLGFPDFWTDDGPHGVRPDVLWDEWEQAGQTNDSCVAFPALTCLAATWNPQMARWYGDCLGEEALYRGKNMILGPGVNIYRTPLNGRNFEYMGEDPYLASAMVVPYIQGLQSKGVAACVKHYALNNDENYRHQVNVIVDDRALHEIYLPAFKAAVVNGGAWGIMGAYNLYQNQHNCHNDILLNKILKKDWGFDGVVVSDWGGCHDTEQAITAGLDMEFGTWTDGLTMGKTNAYDLYHMAEAYKNLIKSGKYTEKELNDKVRRVLRLFFRTTMNRHKEYGFLCSEQHYDVARKIAGEGVVLLQNQHNLLPMQLEGKKKVLVVGENAIKMMTVGGGSSSLKAQKEILPLDGLMNVLKNRYPQLMVDYARGYVGDTVQSYNGVTVGRRIADYRPADVLRNEAVEKARLADYVIIFGGLNKSDFQDCEGHDRRQYDLPYGQDELVEALCNVNSHVVFVNISGNAVAMPWYKKVDAIIQGWYLGSESGEALADVLLGDVNPSGKLPFTWPVKLEDVPAHRLGAFPGEWRENHDIIDEEYKEGIFVGYRGVDKWKTKPLFAFGHGLSYTTFGLGKVTADKKTIRMGDNISFSVSVTNQGQRVGAEVVQLYVRDMKSSLPRPVKELKGFQKVVLQPGETQTVTINLHTDDLKFYDDSKGEWIAEPGEFEVLVGTASDRLSSSVRFTLN